MVSYSNLLNTRYTDILNHQRRIGGGGEANVVAPTKVTQSLDCTIISRGGT